MGQLVLLRMKTVGSAPDEKSFYSVANKRDWCAKVSLSKSKRKFRFSKNTVLDIVKRDRTA